MSRINNHVEYSNKSINMESAARGFSDGVEQGFNKGFREGNDFAVKSFYVYANTYPIGSPPVQRPVYCLKQTARNTQYAHNYEIGIQHGYSQGWWRGYWKGHYSTAYQYQNEHKNEMKNEVIKRFTNIDKQQRFGMV